MNRIQDRIIAAAVILVTAGLALVLLYSMGEIKGTTADQRRLQIDFTRIDDVGPNISEVKFAGMPVGRVEEVRILTPRERAERIEAGKRDRYIRVTVLVRPDIILATNTQVTVRQTTLTGDPFIDLIPGPPEIPAMPDGFVLEGLNASGIADLAEPGARLLDTLNQAGTSIKDLAASVNRKLPVVLDGVNAMIADGRGLVNRTDRFVGGASVAISNVNLVVADVATPGARADIRQIIANLRFVSADLKVVSTHAKIFTATIAQRPWRVFFGGKPNELPEESRILKSNRAIEGRPAEGNR